MKINLLESSVYNKISAGEVVENPASIVKELGENSIDAGATELLISIEKGGLKSINVIDNGDGIEKSSLGNAILPHATSKITNADDLFSINTLGFRGEALASISSVSDFTIETIYNKEKVGSKLRHYDNITKIEDIAHEKGTAITVQNLFYNTPARFKFLKSEKQEENNVTKIVTDLILANPKIKIKYNIDGKCKLDSPGLDLFNATSAIYGVEVMKNMLSVDYTSDYVTIRGFISNHNLYRNNRNNQTLMVNGRVINNKTLSESIQNYYKNILVSRNFPIIVLNIILPYDKVDVNVHPGKKEVRFENERLIASSLYYAVKNVNSDFFDFTNKSLFKAVDVKSDIKIESTPTLVMNNKIDITKDFDIKEEINLIDQIKSKTNNNEFVVIKNKDHSLNYELNKSVTKNLADKKFIVHTIDEKDEIVKEEKFVNLDSKIIDEEKLSSFDKEFIKGALAKNSKKELPYKILGQIFDTYLLVYSGEDFYILDQHAIHERIIYDGLLESYENKAVQTLMLPEIFDIPIVCEDAVIEDFISVISLLGFEGALFGENCIKIDTIPLIMTNINLNKFLNEVWETFYIDKNNTDKAVFKEKFATIACKNAIKGGDGLSEEKVEYFIKYFLEKKLPLYCPHGRPTLINITKSQLEKMFRRVI